MPLEPTINPSRNKVLQRVFTLFTFSDKPDGSEAAELVEGGGVRFRRQSLAADDSTAVGRLKGLNSMLVL